MIFETIHILYERNGFTIAWGEFEEEPTLAMRWANEGIGFPQSRGKEAWLVIPQELHVEFLTPLIGKDGANNRLILEVLYLIINAD